MNLSSQKHNTLETPDGHKVPITRHGSLLFLRPTLAPFNKDEFEVVCNTFHSQQCARYLSGPNSFAHLDLLSRTDKWELSGHHFDHAYASSRERCFLFSRRD